MAIRAAVEGAAGAQVIPEAWGILAAFVAGMSGWVKVLLDQRAQDQERDEDQEQQFAAAGGIAQYSTPPPR